MSFKNIAISSLLVPAAVAACTNYTRNGLTWTSALRMNHMQVIGTHNSYHLEGELAEYDAMRTYFGDNLINYLYGHPSVANQLEHQQVRSLEIDVYADPEGGHYSEPLVRSLAGLPYSTDPALREPGVKVLHVADFDIHSTCNTLVGCLQGIKAWLDANPSSVPVPIMMEFKTAEARAASLGGATPIPWNDQTLLQGLDEEIRSVFPDEQLITPDDLRRGNLTLEESVLRYGWPDLDSARGRIFFLMDNGPDHDVRTAYIQNRPSLEGRVLFTNSAPGRADTAFQKLNEPNSPELAANIQKQVSLNYWVRTRSDVPMETVLACSTEMREWAFRSGAQIVSTDFPVYGPSSRWRCDYAAQLPGGKAAQCNPVTAPEGCEDEAVEASV